MNKEMRAADTNRIQFVTHTYHDPFRPGDNELGMQPNERNKPELESKPSECIEHRCGKVDRSDIEAHLKRAKETIITFGLA